MQIVQERHTPISYVTLVSGHSIEQINTDLAERMDLAQQDGYTLIRAKTEVAFGSSGAATGLALWTVTLEFTDATPAGGSVDAAPVGDGSGDR